MSCLCTKLRDSISYASSRLKNGYIFVINVPEREILPKWDQYDHGFIDINANKLATQEFKDEEEVLFNALNIYKVKDVKNLGQYTYIYLQYGAIFDILAKPKISLTLDEN